ncbi:MAG: oligopeptide transporter, OPT family [Candidatus Thermoplasmatota archaeon]|nr:oligopeptide transporter, OPT family [Candidatus Thermoplasmatota archaeon]MDD5778316.1 oligopeptide transporter, OPT family [Candidatus Thermoplasmatota archaeon]
MSREDFKSFIPADQTLPELTLKAVLVGMILAIIMGSANAYLGLYAGMTVSAAIPGAIMALALLKPLKGNILENVIGMQGAAAGEALAAGIIFTIPALVVIGAWDSIHYLETTVIALIGGILGVLWMIPLRRALIIKTDLPFPEGIAVAAVMTTAVGDGEEGEGTGGSIWMVVGALLAGLVKFSQVSLNIFRGSVEDVIDAGKYYILGQDRGGYFYGGAAASPALLGVGYIVGPRIASFVFAGGILGWIILTPLILLSTGMPGDAATPIDGFYKIWEDYVRYIGVGAMVVGGLYTIWGLRNNLMGGIKEAVVGLRGGEVKEKKRTEADLDFKKVFLTIGFLVIPTFIIYAWVSEQYAISAFMSVLLVIAAFLASAIAGYMAGLLGSSNNPISGVTVAVLLFVSIIMLAFGATGLEGMTIVILMAAVVCCAGAISGDVLQSLAAGQMIGSTPYKQQLAEIFGILAAAPVLGIVVKALDSAYGIGTKNLPAPQAFLMGGIVKGVIGGEMVWPYVIAGAFLALVLIMMDIPVLPVAIGTYLPLTLSIPIFAGGIVRALVDRYINKRSPNSGQEDEASDWEMAIQKHGVSPKEKANRTGLLFTAGLIAGEALVGVISAFLIIGHIDIALLGKAPAWPGMLVWGYIAFLMGYIVIRTFNKARAEHVET